MSTKLSVDIDYPIGTYAFTCSGPNAVTRVKINAVVATWHGRDFHIVYGIEGLRHAVYKPENLFPTAEAAFAVHDADNDDADEDDDEDEDPRTPDRKFFPIRRRVHD